VLFTDFDLPFHYVQVLADDAEAFAEKLWRMVLVDSLGATEGLRI